MALSNYEMEIVRRKSEQEPAIIEKLFSKKLDAATDYAKFLVRNDHELPEVLVNIISTNTANYGKLVTIAAILKVKGLEVPKKLIDIISSNGSRSYDYAMAVLSEDSEAEIEPEIFNAIMKDDANAHSFTVNILQDNPRVQLPDEMIALLKYNPQAAYNIVIQQLQNRIKKYKDLDKNLIEAIARDSRLASRFAHFVQPYVDETPEEILKNIKDPKTIRAKWHTGVTVKESFRNFFKSKN